MADTRGGGGRRGRKPSEGGASPPKGGASPLPPIILNNINFEKWKHRKVFILRSGTPPTMARTYKSYKAPGTRPPPPIFHEVSATECDAIGRLLHYTKNSLSSPCTSQHKHEQKDKTKTLVKFPDHVFIDFDTMCTYLLVLVDFKGSGWWHHEYCHGKHVLQYHTVILEFLVHYN